MSLALDLARALDPAAIAEGIGMVPDPWQDEVLHSDEDTLLNCHRQAGKSTTAAVIGVHRAVYRARRLVLIFSPSMRQSGEIFQKCLAIYRGLGRPVIAEAENALSLILENGSRIISLPGSEATVRGYSGVDTVLLDEAARVHDALIPAVRPMLAISGGRMVAMSTPNGKRGWFWETWVQGGKSWKRIKVPATECPRISKKFLEEERQALGERLFAQEYMCEFVETTDQAFGEEAIDQAFSRDVEAIRLEDRIDLGGPVS